MEAEVVQLTPGTYTSAQEEAFVKDTQDMKDTAELAPLENTVLAKNRQSRSHQWSDDLDEQSRLVAESLASVPLFPTLDGPIQQAKYASGRDTYEHNMFGGKSYDYEYDEAEKIGQEDEDEPNSCDGEAVAVVVRERGGGRASCEAN